MRKKPTNWKICYEKRIPETELKNLPPTDRYRSVTEYFDDIDEAMDRYREVKNDAELNWHVPKLLVIDAWRISLADYGV